MKEKKIDNRIARSGGSRFWKAALLTVAAGSFIFVVMSRFIVVVGEKNGKLLGSMYKIEEEDFDNPRLQLLRKRERLDDVVASGRTQFEKFVLLRQWTRKLWKGEKGGQFYYPPWDAVEIIDLARKIDNEGFCAQFAIVFLQACQSLGLHARYVDLPDHFVVAVWSDEFNDWVIMDPTADIHYEKNGFPLGGHDLLEAYWNNKVRGIFKVGSDGSRKHIKKEDIAQYRIFSIMLSANQIREPVQIIQNGVKKILVLDKNYKNYPVIGKDTLSFCGMFLAWKEDGRPELSNKIMSGEAADFEYPENQSIIEHSVLDPKRGIVRLRLFADNSPTFKTFMLKGDREGWSEVPNKVEVTLHPGVNKISAKIITQYGWEGPTSYIKLYYKPRWFPKTADETKKHYTLSQSEEVAE